LHHAFCASALLKLWQANPGTSGLASQGLGMSTTRSSAQDMGKRGGVAFAQLAN
jgi:hypothetical protein